jgi:tetratricopeptide (TPR) repeat protein
VATEELILEAVRGIADASAVRYALGETNRALVLRRGLRLESLRLSAADGYLLSRVDGLSTGRELMETLPQGEEEVQRTLLGLLCAGIVEFEGPVKARGRLGDIATRAAERAQELGIAVAKPAPPPEPAPPPPATEPEAPVEDEVARESLAKARFELAEGRPGEAARILETVVELVDGALRADVRRLLAEALLAEPSSEKRGEAQLQILIAESPRDVDAHFMLASVYRRKGLRSRAEAMFRRVLELDPGHAAARAALDPPAEERSSPNLWGRLRGKG